MWTCIWKCNVCFSIITVNKLLKTFSLVSFFLHEKKSFTQSALKKSVSCSLKSEMKVSHVDLYKTVWELRRNWKWNSNSLWKKKDFQTNQELQVCVDLYWSLKANHIPFGKKHLSQSKTCAAVSHHNNHLTVMITVHDLTRLYLNRDSIFSHWSVF